MTEEQGFYYLHTDGSLIFKPAIVADDPEYFNSPFVKKVWRMDFTNRLDAWKLVLEAFCLGARADRIKELAQKWGLTLEDSIEMLKRTPKDQLTEGMREGLPLFVACILQMTPDEYWTKVREDWDGKSKEERGKGKRIINKILREFGYHLTKFPKPYKRKKKESPPLWDFQGYRPAGPGDGG